MCAKGILRYLQLERGKELSALEQLPRNSVTEGPSSTPPLGTHLPKKCQDLPRTLETQELGHVHIGITQEDTPTLVGPHTLSSGVSKVCPGIA